MGFQESFERSEWQTLQFAPLWVYQLVANADRDIDDKESERIVEEIAKAAGCEDPLAGEVLKSVTDNYFPVAERFAFDDRRSLDGLRDVAGLLKEKASPPGRSRVQGCHDVDRQERGGVVRRGVGRIRDGRRRGRDAREGIGRARGVRVGPAGVGAVLSDIRSGCSLRREPASCL